MDSGRHYRPARHLVGAVGGRGRMGLSAREEDHISAYYAYQHRYAESLQSCSRLFRLCEAETIDISLAHKLIFWVLSVRVHRLLFRAVVYGQHLLSEVRGHDADGAHGKHSCFYLSSTWSDSLSHSFGALKLRYLPGPIMYVTLCPAYTHLH